MTLSKLAQLANVSVSVVSKAFSGRDDVSDSMREHVFAVAREHGCFHQFYHKRYDKPVIAVIIPEAISKHYIRFIETLKKDMEENGYTMLLSISNFDNTLKDELVRYYTEHSKVDGLILIDSGYALPSKCKTVLISMSHHTLTLGSSISFNRQTGLRACLSELISKGHKRIAYIGEEHTAKYKKFMLGLLTELGCEADESLFYTSRLRFEEAGRDGVRKLFAKGEPPTAIIGAYGYITKGILEELESMDIRVPQDVSVVSMDNDPSPIYGTLDVSCIPSDIEKRCEYAMNILRERLGTASPNTPTQIVIDSEFHVGDSIGTAKS